MAGQLLCLAMMVLLVLFPRRLGPAVTVMPWLVFYLSTRSQQDYFDLTVPLWVMAAATVSAADFDRAWHPRAGWLGSRVLRAALVPVLVAPTAVTIAAAMLTPPPLKMTVTAMSGTAGSGQLALVDLLQRVQVTVTNTSGEPVTPHFATSTGATISDYWKVLSGPATLPAHATAVYRLSAPYGGVGTPGVKGRMLLRAVAPAPMSISSQLIGVGPDPSTLPLRIRRILAAGVGFGHQSQDAAGGANGAPHTGVEGLQGR
jgi:hypothetical protein